MSEQKSPTAIIHLGDTKHIEPGKTYSIEVEQLAPLYANEIENIIRTFEEATGAKAVLVQGAKVKDSGVVTMPVEELRKLTEAIQRVRELHVQETPITEFCKECSYTYPCPTIQVLDGEQIATDVKPNITVTSYPMLMLSTERLTMPKALDGEQ